jgi:hypothetical protein
MFTGASSDLATTTSKTANALWGFARKIFKFLLTSGEFKLVRAGSVNIDWIE